MIHPKTFRPHCMAIVCLLITFFQSVTAQVQTFRDNVSMGPNTNGYIEYLPKGYDQGSQFPLMIFVHGVGELGNGNQGNLHKLLRHGPPKVIDQGNFPSSFNVNGQNLSFIVISPQFFDWPSPQDIDKVINYSIQHYKVDQSRIYLTGLSMGGGVVWSYVGYSKAYASRIAAIVPISGAAGADFTEARTITATNMGVWALHNNYDNIVPSYYTVNWTNYINTAPAPNPPAKRTIFNAGGHDAWSNVYNMNYTENGMNIYEWMLHFKKGGNIPGTIPINLPPVANAGSNQTITLP